MSQGEQQSAFLFFSDVHFDPFADPALVKTLAATDVSSWRNVFASSSQKSPSAYGSDANYVLLESALDSMASTAGKVDLIIFPGDALAHDFEKKYATLTGDTSQAGLDSFVQKTVTFFANEVDRRFPDALVLTAIGNNDSAIGDYKSRPGDPYLSLTAAPLAKAFFNNDADRAAFTMGYQMSGSYAVEPDGPTGRKYIVLNDIFASPRSDQDAAAVAELAWFSMELADSARDLQSVWVVGHIPMGASAKSMAEDFGTKGFEYKGLLKNGFNDAFMALEVAYAPIIQATFTGHTHRDEFRLISPGPMAMPTGLVSISNSISPIDSNNPGYEIYTFNPTTGALIDKASYSLDLSRPGTAWKKEYDFAATYGHGLGSPQEWMTVGQDLFVNPVSRAAYSTYYTAGSTLPAATPVTPANFPVYWLAATNVTESSFNASAAMLAGG